MTGSAIAPTTEQLRGYQADGGPFPERLHLIMLFSRFYLGSCCTAGLPARAARWPAGRPPGTSASPMAPGRSSTNCSGKARS